MTNFINLLTPKANNFEAIDSAEIENGINQ